MKLYLCRQKWTKCKIDYRVCVCGLKCASDPSIHFQSGLPVGKSLSQSCSNAPFDFLSYRLLDYFSIQLRIAPTHCLKHQNNSATLHLSHVHILVQAQNLHIYIGLKWPPSVYTHVGACPVSSWNIFSMRSMCVFFLGGKLTFSQLIFCFVFIFFFFFEN